MFPLPEIDYDGTGVPEGYVTKFTNLMQRNSSLPPMQLGKSVFQ